MLWSAFILGLISSFHCIGMCGPLAMALSSTNRKEKAVINRLAYNLGRTTTYALFGLFIGSLGLLLQFNQYQPQLSIISGAIIILISILNYLGKVNLELRIPGFNKVKSGLGKLLKFNSTGGQYVFGLLNGLLPCGLVYFALAASVAQGSAILSMSYMAVFGLGTIPLMFIFSLGIDFVKISWRNTIRKNIPLVSLFIGILFLLRGLNLGIPFLSPDTRMDQTTRIEEGVHCK